MAKKIQKAPVPIESVVCNEVLTRKDGVSVRVYVDLATISELALKRQQALLISRHIPLDRVNISPLDPVVTAYRQQLPEGYDDDEIMTMARQHYEQFVQEAAEDAMVLAFFSHKDNNGLANPTPYQKEDTPESNDDLISVPPPVKNLLHPTERKLKQIYDFLQSDAELLFAFRSIFNRVTLRINAMVEAGGASEAVDDAGFQPERTGGNILTLNVPPSVQPKVEA